MANKHSGQSAIQFMLGYTPIYTNNKIIAKPPVKASKESLGSALDSFYNDIARIERTETERVAQHQDPVVTEQVPASVEDTKPPETEPDPVSSDTTTKEKKKKKVFHLSRNDSFRNELKKKRIICSLSISLFFSRRI